MPNHQAQHERTEKCLNGLKNISLSNQPASGYHDRYYGHAWFVATYTVNPWNNTQASGPRKDEKNSLADGTSCPTSNTTFTTKQHNRGKRNPTTLDTNKDIPSGHQRQKKPLCGVKVDTAAKEKKYLGMFYLRNLSINPADIFPKNMPKKLYANFTCMGKECNNTNCDFAHPRKALELKRKTIILIANNHQERHGMVQPIPFHEDAQHHR